MQPGRLVLGGRPYISPEYLEVARGAQRVRVYWRHGKAVAAADLPPVAAGATRFVCISDTHGKTQQLVPGGACALPAGHVLLHAGDFTSTGTPTQVTDFAAFLATAPAPERVVIAGNHDIVFDVRLRARPPPALTATPAEGLLRRQVEPLPQEAL